MTAALSFLAIQVLSASAIERVATPIGVSGIPSVVVTQLHIDALTLAPSNVAAPIPHVTAAQLPAAVRRLHANVLGMSPEPAAALARRGMRPVQEVHVKAARLRFDQARQIFSRVEPAALVAMSPDEHRDMLGALWDGWRQSGVLPVVVPKSDGHLQVFAPNGEHVFLDPSDLPAGAHGDEIFHRVVAGGIRYRDPYRQDLWPRAIGRDWPPHMVTTSHPMILRRNARGIVTLSDPNGPNGYGISPRVDYHVEQGGRMIFTFGAENRRRALSWSAWAVAPFKVMPGSPSDPGTLIAFPVEAEERASVGAHTHAGLAERWNYDAVRNLMVLNPYV